MAEKEQSTEAAAKMLTSSPASERKNSRNDHTSPAHQATNHNSSTASKQDALTPPAVSDKKPQTNRHASPVRLPASTSSKQCVEGYLKTDDRMRLAKERREEREKSLAAREQAIREKEHRARLQYERTVEERWRRLEEQRLKEEQRRAAVEEKRRQQLEEEKERLEALMRRSLERSLQLENRNKRWVWGASAGVQSDWENTPPLSAAFALPHDLAAPSPATSESGNVQHGHLTSLENLTHHRLHTHTHSSLARCNSAADLGMPCPRCTVSSSPHRSPYRGSPSRRRGNTVPMEESRGSSTAPNTPKKERLRSERRAGSPAAGSPVRRAESPANIVRRSASPATPKLSPKNRNQSPVTIRQYPPSPLRHRPNPPTAESNKAEDKVINNKQAQEVRDQDAANKKPLNTEATSQQVLSSKTAAEKTEIQDKVCSTKTENPNTAAKALSGGQRSPEEKNSKPGIPERKSPKNSTDNVTADRNADRSPPMPNGKAVAGTTDAEEASRLLAERRRLARIQKEHDDQERLKAEQLRKRQAEERCREEENARRAEEQRKAKREEDERKKREEEEKKVQREEAGVRALKEVERQRQERELLKQHEEEERQQRKKRIEEIMKRTRRSDGEMKREDSQELQSPPPQTLSPPGEMQVNSKVNGEVKAPPSGTGVSSPPHAQVKLKPISKQEKPESPSVSDGKQSSVHACLKNPSPTEENDRGNSPEQKEKREPGTCEAQRVKPPNHSAAREEVNVHLRKEEISLMKVKITQTKAENSAPKPEEKREAIQVKPPIQVPSLTPQKQVSSTAQEVMYLGKQEIGGQVKNCMSQQVNDSGPTPAPQQKTTVKIIEGPQVNGKNLQMSTQASAVQVKSSNGQTSSEGISKDVVKESSPASFPQLAVSKAPPPLINLEHLEGRGKAGEGSTDEVQSMEVSPVSKEELVSIPEFSPVTDVQHNGMSNARALEDLLDLTGHVAYPKLSPGTTMGDCNKNLIEGVCSPGAETKIIPNNTPASNKLNTK